MLEAIDKLMPITGHGTKIALYILAGVILIAMFLWGMGLMDEVTTILKSMV